MSTTLKQIVTDAFKATFHQSTRDLYGNTVCTNCGHTPQEHDTDGKCLFQPNSVFTHPTFIWDEINADYMRLKRLSDLVYQKLQARLTAGALRGTPDEITELFDEASTELENDA